MPYNYAIIIIIISYYNYYYSPKEKKNYLQKKNITMEHGKYESYYNQIFTN